jgi:hypothetical protein
MALDWAGDTRAYDDRNEGSVNWARATESKGLPRI